MIIWRGLGILVAIAGFLGFIVAEFATRALTHDDTYYSSHPLPKLGGAVLGALLAFVADRLLERRRAPRVLIDPATGQQVVIRRGDSVFFIPSRFLPYVILAVGVVVAFVHD